MGSEVSKRRYVQQKCYVFYSEMMRCSRFLPSAQDKHVAGSIDSADLGFKTGLCAI